MSPFLAINAKGGENIKPKAKGPHHQIQKKLITKVCFSNWYLMIEISSIGMIFSISIFKDRFSKLASKYTSNWYLLKPS
jgi:hypothetical protein